MAGTNPFLLSITWPENSNSIKPGTKCEAVVGAACLSPAQGIWMRGWNHGPKLSCMPQTERGPAPGFHQEQLRKLITNRKRCRTLTHTNSEGTDSPSLVPAFQSMEAGQAGTPTIALSSLVLWS